MPSRTPSNLHKPLAFSASVMCADFRRLEADLDALEGAGCDELHFDIMDGVFVPNITLGFDIIKVAKSCCGLPCSAHLMIQRPERYVERVAAAGADSITVHQEACPHVHRVLAQIRDAGASPGVAVNPATPLTKLDFVLEQADRVLMMTVDPGYAGQRILKNSFERVRILKENIDYRKLRTRIEVDGNIDVTNGAILANMGAEIFVLGSSSIFNGSDPRVALPHFRQALDAERKVV